MLSDVAVSRLDRPRVVGPPGDRRLPVEYLRVIHAHALVPNVRPRQVASVICRGRDVDEGGVDVPALLLIARTESFQNLPAVGERHVGEAARVAPDDEIEEFGLGDEERDKELLALRRAL